MNLINIRRNGSVTCDLFPKKLTLQTTTTMRKMIWIQQQPLIKVYFFYWWPPASQLKETEVKLNLQNATLQQYNSLLEWSSWGGKPHTLNFFLSMHFGFKKCTFLSVNVFSTKVLKFDAILMSPTGDGATILCGHSSHVKVWLIACRAKVVPSLLSYFREY